MSYKVDVKKSKQSDFAGSNLTTVTMNLTTGELIALQEMLRRHETAVQSDLCSMFANALQRNGISLP